MAERDVSGKATQLSTKVIARVRERMKEVMPYGPLRQYLTREEIRLKLQNMDAGVKQNLMQRVGDEEWRNMMQDLYGDK